MLTRQHCQCTSGHQFHTLAEALPSSPSKLVILFWRWSGNADQFGTFFFVCTYPLVETLLTMAGRAQRRKIHNNLCQQVIMAHQPALLLIQTICFYRARRTGYYEMIVGWREQEMKRLTGVLAIYFTVLLAKVVIF